MPPVNRRPVCSICQPASCTAAPSWRHDRTRENLSAISACFGSSSEISKASVFVRIGLKGPRISAAASGFMSQRSSWLGPPRLKIMMQDRFSWPGRTFPSLAARTYCGSDSPTAARAPT